MKKTIEELLSGNFRHEHPQLLFSQDKIEVTLKAGDVYKGELYFGTEDNQKIRGYITSSNRRVVPGTEKFSGTTVRLQYGIDGAGMHPGERHEGWLCFTTDIGEYKLPFLIQTEKAELKSAAGDVPDMDTFVNIAKDDFKEAYRVFTDRRFELLLRNAGQKEKALYKGLSKQPVTFQHVEEFLIGTGKKDPVKIELKADQNSFYDISESVRETFAVQRSGWGHLRLEVEAKGDFLEVSRHVVTDEDFIGSYYQVEYIAVVLHAESSKARFADAATLLNFAFANYSLYSIAANTVIPPVRVRFAETDSMQPVLSGADAIVVRKGTAAPQTDIALDEELCAPLEPGAQVGTVTVTDSSGDTRILPLVVPDGAARISTAHLWLQLLRAL